MQHNIAHICFEQPREPTEFLASSLSGGRGRHDTGARGKLSVVFLKGNLGVLCHIIEHFKVFVGAEWKYAACPLKALQCQVLLGVLCYCIHRT